MIEIDKEMAIRIVNKIGSYGDIVLRSDMQEVAKLIDYQDKEIERLHSIIKEAREVLENKREKMTNQLLYVGCCDYEELLYQVDEEIGIILDKVEQDNDIEFDVLKALNTDLDDDVEMG